MLSERQASRAYLSLGPPESQMNVEGGQILGIRLVDTMSNSLFLVSGSLLVGLTSAINNMVLSFKRGAIMMAKIQDYVD
jgi:hypothetical protein